MKKYFLIAISAQLLFINADCKNDIVSPDDTKPGSRNYAWTIDTVYAPYNLFGRITGTSPNDLWTANTGDAEKTFYHFDGNKWSTDLIARPISPSSIYSLSPTSVWSGGDRGKIWHWNGSVWSEKYIHTIAGYTEGAANITFEDIYAQSEKDIYAVGQYYNDSTRWGLILHFDGSSWQQINIPQIRTAFVKIRIDATNNKLFLWGVSNERFIESSYQFYEFDGETLLQIKSGTQANDQLGTILELGNKIYFIIGYDFFEYDNSNFIKIGHLSSLPQFINAGIGRSAKDIFVGLLDGIAHYNGENTEYLVHFHERVTITGFKIFEKDIFVIGWDLRGNNLIYHGKLHE